MLWQRWSARVMRVIMTGYAVLLAVTLLASGTYHFWSLGGSFAHEGLFPPAQSVIYPLTGTPVTSTATQIYWQVGATASSDARDTTAMRTRIHTDIPTAVADQTTNYFWIGSYLSDGSFIQVGYAVPWFDKMPRWFYCEFDRAGKKGPCQMGEPNSIGAEGEWHSYALESRSDATSGTWQWVALVDGVAVGSIPENVGTTGSYTPSIFVEQSAFAPHAATNDLGPVEFYPAIEFQTANSDQYTSAASARATYSLPSATCPPYGLGVAGANDIVLGSGLGCPPSGTWLW